MRDIGGSQYKQGAQGVVDYIHLSRAELSVALEKSAALEKKHRAYQIKVAEAVDNLVERGVVPLASKMALYEELVNNPERAAEMLVKLSEQVGPPTLGAPGELEDLDSRDAIERFALDHTFEEKPEMAFNVVKGRPIGGALDHNVAPTAGEGIVAGMFVKRDATTGKLVKADGSAKEVAMFVLDDQGAFDVQEADSLPVLIMNALVETDQFIAGVFAPGDELQVSVTGGEEGKIKKHLLAGAPTVGWVDDTVTVDGIPMIRLILIGPIGAAA